jgi:hypothetical protein
MVGNRIEALRSRLTDAPETTLRILFGVCAAVWLLLLGVSVAAVVALVDLGRGFQGTAADAHTGLLYGIIGVSALIIVASIPVLLHARRTLQSPARRANTPQRRPVHTGPRGRTGILAAEEAGVSGRPATAVIAETVDRIWLRGTVSLATALGVALIPVAAATYLMAAGKDGAAWIAYGVAAVVTAMMPVVLWLHLRWLSDVLGAADRSG